MRRPPDRETAAILEVLDGLEDAGFEVCSRYGDANATRAALGAPHRSWWRRLLARLRAAIRAALAALDLVALAFLAGLLVGGACGLVAGWLAP